ncbi:MAG: hypothetical protein AAFX05_13915 [Planctomycetota bacterium]
MADRHLLLVKVLDSDAARADPNDETSGPSVLNMVSLGAYSDVVKLLAQFNTAPDGGQDSIGVLWGPGITMQMPMVGPKDPVMQLMVSMTDENIAWPVLERICATLGWKMMDPKSGRTFG